MDLLVSVNKAISNFVWGPVMLVLLLGTGLYLTIRTGFFSITKLGYVLKNTIMTLFQKQETKGEGEITPFQAVSTALAATVGTGNIAGVATAIATGGPGAVFWMWLSAILGMTTKFAEVVLAVTYREKTEDGRFVGGPMYYLRDGVKSKFLAGLFALLTALAAFGIGNMVQANSVAASLEVTFNIPTLVTGLVLGGLSALVMIGGLKRIASVTERLVPIMAVIYIIGGIVILITNISNILPSLKLIFASAFTTSAAVGGFAGAAMKLALRQGLARGVFSNEAGLGSAPIAHAAATTDNAVRQGLWGVFEVFIDTIVICTMTALVIIASGAWSSGVSGAALTTMAFDQSLPGGGYIVSIGIVLFAFSTLIGWSYYGERGAEYLFGPKVIPIYRLIFIPFIVIGAVGGLELVWDIADTLNGLMAIPNLIGVVVLSGTVISLKKEFFKQEGL